MKAAREALFILVVAFMVIFPLTPGGCYFLYNAKDGYGDLKIVKEYLRDRGVVVLEDRIARRNLGTTRNCEASFKTDVAVFKKLLEDPKCKFVDDGMHELEKKNLAKVPEARRPLAMRDFLRLSPLLSESEKDDFVRAFLVDNLLLYKEEAATLPTGWAYARLLVTKTDGRAYLYYAR